MTLGSSSRNGTPVIWVVLHTTEGITDAAALGPFFEREYATDPNSAGSSHAAIDDRQIIELVPYDQAAWTLRGGNAYSDNAEMCGFAAWDYATWLQHDSMLWNAARWVARRCVARGIPCVKLTPADVALNKPGVIGHVDYTLGKLDGTHWDPGPSFPWDVVISRAQALIGARIPIVRMEDDEMYIKCASYLGKPFTGILSGGILTGLASQGELNSASTNIANGALCVWVEEYTVKEMDRKSQQICRDRNPATVTTA